MQDQIREHKYAVLDAARIFGELETAQSLQTNFLNLYAGQKEEYLSSVAPYLFAYQPGSEFGNWLLEKGWGNAWGIFLSASVSLNDLQMHFRKYLMVKTEEGGELFFRFYDPRVLRKFLPSCDESKLKDFFGPIKSFEMESEDPEFALEFSLEGGKLITRKYGKEGFWKRLNGAEAASVQVESINETPENNKSNPSKKWNFLID